MLSRRAQSAIAATLEVARLARGRPLPAKALAERDGIAPRQFEAVLQDLVRAGVLRSLRGPNGGYELARERRRVTLGDVVRAVDPVPAPSRLYADPEVARALAEAEAAFLARLDAVTLAELCRDGHSPTIADASDFTI